MQLDHHPTTVAVLKLFQANGGSRYGGENVSQLEHALQAAYFAEADGAASPLIAAALLHDVGHLLHDLPADAPDRGIDDRHEALGAHWLKERFGPDVCDPVQLHVDAKRYLCAVDAAYLQVLSGPSIQSLELQGGPMSAEEVARFEQRPHFQDAVRLRRWDDAAKVPELVTPYLEHFARHLDAAVAKEGS
ncbi:phosphonate degradation HD-domain oxygenase [Anatilimnocola sp. NA78]|uniref:phosphonate degradation HD-domain oxygenase n=1 Tax=Anatilimnocola sp. NA78 TaxID=3415683 RepID=UPI003CE57283